MTPGLTCATCERALAPLLARPTDVGYIHVACPPAACTLEGCEDQRFSRGWCKSHWKRWRRHGDPLGGFSRELHLEDVEWMAYHGETLEGAAARTGRTAGALKARLYAEKRHDLIHLLQSRTTPLSA